MKKSKCLKLLYGVIAAILLCWTLFNFYSQKIVEVIRQENQNSIPSNAEIRIENECADKDADDSELLLQNADTGTEIDDHIAMSYLFQNYDPKEKIAAWCPPENSDVFNYLYSKPEYSGLQSSPVFSQKYQQSGIPHFIIIMESERNFDGCHACTVVLGGAIFHKVNGKWKLKVLNRVITATGAWGRAPNQIWMMKIGSDLHGVAVINEFNGQGTHIENYLLIAPVGKRLEEVLYHKYSKEEHVDNCDEKGNGINGNLPCWSYDSNFHFHPGAHLKYYDITIKTAGTKSAEDRTTLEKFKKKVTYHFMGCCYIQGDTVDFSPVKIYCIQAGAFEKYRSARTLFEDLRKKGFPSYCELYESPEGKSLFRVRIGNYNNIQSAEKVLLEIEKEGFIGIIEKRKA